MPTAAKKHLVKTIVPERRRPSLASRNAEVAAKPKPSKPSAYPGMLGMTEFGREVKDAVERASKEKTEVLFSTSRRLPHIRLRAASLHQDEADDIPEDYHLTVTELREDTAPYRHLVMVGKKFLLASGKHEVIMDRHPDCPNLVYEKYMKLMRAEIRSGAQASTRRHARRAADGTDKMFAYVRRMAADQEARDLETAERSGEIVRLLARVLETGVLSTEDRKLLVRMALREKKELASKGVPYGGRTPTASDLDRYEVD